MSLFLAYGFSDVFVAIFRRSFDLEHKQKRYHGLHDSVDTYILVCGLFFVLREHRL